MTHDANIQNCSKIFVSWVWALTFIGSFIVLIAGLSWSTSAAYSQIIINQSLMRTDINSLKIAYFDMDTVKMLLRQNHDLLIAKIRVK